jgi:autotransporter family porin
MATYTWVPSGGGDFNVASNWTLDGVTASTAPGPNDIAEFDVAATGTISGNFNIFELHPFNNASNWTFTGQITIVASDIHGTMTLASGASITASVGIGVAEDAGALSTLVVGPGASYINTLPAQSGLYPLNIGNGSNATGTVIVEGPGSLVDTEFNGASVAVGAATGTGLLQISDGGIAEFATTNPNQLVSLAVGRSGTGTVTVDGAGSQLQLTGIMYAGRGTTGNATVTLANGASLTETAVGVGFATRFGSGGLVNGVFTPAGTGTFNVLSDSTATFGDSLNFGDDGATGVGLVSNGTVNVGGLLRFGSSTPVGGGFTAPGGNGTLTINDGGIVRDTAAADSSTAYVQLGATAGTTGTVSVDGWGSLLDAGTNAIDVGTFGTGTLTASDDGLITSTGLTVGDHGNGTLNLTDGGVAITNPPSGTGSAFTVGAQAGGTGFVGVSGHGSVLIAAGEAVLGGTDTSSGIAAGGTGDVSVSQGGLLGTGSMIIEAGSNLGIDGTSAAIIAGNLSDDGGVTTSGFLAVTDTMSGAGTLTLDGGLANLGSLDSANVTFGDAPAVLRTEALSGTSNVSSMQVGDVIDFASQPGVTLTNDTVTTSSGMMFLNPAPAGDTYQLIHSLDGTALALIPASGHGMSDIAAADTSLSLASLTDAPHISGDFLQHLVVDAGMRSVTFAATNEMVGYVGASAGVSPNSAALDLLMAHYPFAG